MIRRRANSQRWYSLAPDSFEDDRLSWDARGLLVYLLAKPNDWEVSVQQLAQASPDGIGVVRAALQELQQLGYAELVQVRDHSGHRAKGRQWVISDSADTSLTSIQSVRQKEEATTPTSLMSGKIVRQREQPTEPTSLTSVISDVRTSDVQLSRMITYELKTDLEIQKTKDTVPPAVFAPAVLEPDLSASACTVSFSPSQNGHHSADGETPDALPTASRRKGREKKPLPTDGSDWPEETKDLYTWLATQDILTTLPVPLHFKWWATMTYIVGYPSIPWLEKQFAKIEGWCDDPANRIPTPRGTSKFLRGWLERNYNWDRKYA